MSANIELFPVRRVSGGRSHLTVHVPERGPVQALCGQSLPEGGFLRVDEADCRNCLRRRNNPALVSTSFFEQDAGSQLLELAVAQAREQRKNRAPSRAAGASPPPSHPGPKPSEGRRHQDAAGVPGDAGDTERPFAGLKQFGENVYQTPAGAVVRLDPTTSEVVEVIFEGRVRAERMRSGRLVLRVGDVLVEYSPDGPRVVGKLKLQ